ncbi:transglycosylase domain-containing protein [Euzebya tangerina]|uniref:transglycosylase domain-containing protein n=1 Tax=Euzebya tangerina TaxID=591198 RepID=UPI000E313F7B|nr:transglycosylase domain-containing protein [Euzebya tangerina]
MASPSLPLQQPSYSDPHVLLRLLLAILLVPLLIIGAGTAFGAGLVPTVQPLAHITNRVNTEVFDFPPIGDILEGYRAPERSVILDANGDELAVLRAVNRVNVTIEEIPLHVQNAVLATEDQEFRNHQGVNWRAIGRAALGNIRAGDIESGASTITQQLIKNITGQAETTIERKMAEAVYAIELEQNATKDEILEIYMNEAYLGNQVYGFGAAAEFYFGKDISQLTIDEAAMLAGMLRAPNANDPLNDPRAALERRNIVIQQMVSAEFITEDEALAVVVGAPAEATDDQIRDILGLNIQPIAEAEQPFFVNYIRTLLREIPELGVDAEARERLVLEGGLTINTTVDPALQEIAQNAITEVLSNPDGPQSALTSIDPQTGQILAIGFGPKEFGSGPGQTEVLPAVPGVGSSFGRQPGSSFKAFEIVAALEAGVTPAYTIDTPSPYNPTGQCANSGWNPGNYSDGSGGTMNMARATAISSNVYFAHLVDRFTGPQGLADTATRMGIRNTELDPSICATVLGASEVYPLDMASGFGTMANDGIRCEPFAIQSIEDADGNEIYRGGDRCEQVISPEHAAAATSLLRGPIENGTASRNGQIGRPAAGKTGTTQDWRDAWFVGYVPQMSTAVWVGNETPSTMRDSRCGNVTGGCLPTIIWRNFMVNAIEYRNLEVADFPPPPRLPSDRVPSVVGMMEEQAIATLADAEFSAESVVVADYRPEGTVVAQSPSGGSEAPRGTLVVLNISDGTGAPPEVPEVVGLGIEEATQVALNAGLDPILVEQGVSDPDLIGVVIDARIDGETGQLTLVVGREQTEEEAASEEPSEEPDGSEPPEPLVSPGATDLPDPQPTDDGGDGGEEPDPVDGGELPQPPPPDGGPGEEAPDGGEPDPAEPPEPVVDPDG